MPDCALLQLAGAEERFSLEAHNHGTFFLNVLYLQHELRAKAMPDCVGRVLLAGAEERGDRGAAPLPCRGARAVPHSTLAVQQADADDAQYRQAGAQGTSAHYEHPLLA